MTTTMRAIGFTEFGGPDVLREIELPMPRPQRGEVVVAVAAATVNPTDLMMRAGRQASLMTGLQPPYIAGMEFAGRITAVGAEVPPARVGQPVMGIVNPRRPAGGAYAQYVAVPAASVCAIEPGTDPAAAATIPMNGLTALMVMEALDLPRGATVLVTGGAGAVAGYVIALARHAGLVPIADGHAADRKLIASFGAAEIVPRGPDLVAAVRRLRPQGVDGLVDTALIGREVAGVVRDGGVTVALRRGHVLDDPRLRNFGVSVTERDQDTAGLERLGALLRDGVLVPRIAHRLPFREAAHAHRLVERGGQRGRVVLLFAD